MAANEARTFSRCPCCGKTWDLYAVYHCPACDARSCHAASYTTQVMAT